MFFRVVTIGASAILSACVSTGPRTSEILQAENAEVISSEERLNFSVVSLNSDLAARATRVGALLHLRGRAPFPTGSAAAFDVGRQLAHAVALIERPAATRARPFYTFAIDGALLP